MKITSIRGNTLLLAQPVNDSQGSPYQFSTETIKCSLRKVGTTEPLFTVSNQGVTPAITTESGLIKIHLSKTLMNIPVGIYDIDIEVDMISENEFRKTTHKGFLELEENITSIL